MLSAGFSGWIRSGKLSHKAVVLHVNMSKSSNCDLQNMASYSFEEASTVFHSTIKP